MKIKNSIDLIENFYKENTLIAIVLIAIFVFFSQIISPVKAKNTIDHLLPIFIVVLCLEIIFIRNRYNILKRLELKLDIDFEYKSFTSGVEFDNYLDNRLKKATIVKVLHINSQTSNKRENRRYYEIIDNFVRSGKCFRRIFSDSNNSDVYKWMKEDLLKFQKDKYFIHLLDKLKVYNIRTIGIMLIDDEEVCFGGGYVTSFEHPTISVKNFNIVKFFNDYFDYLLFNSINLKNDENINIEILNQRIQELES